MRYNGQYQGNGKAKQHIGIFVCITGLLLCVSSCGTTDPTATVPPTVHSPATSTAPVAVLASQTPAPATQLQATPTEAVSPTVLNSPTPMPVPTHTPAPSPTPQAIPSQYRIANVPLYGEQHNLSCEYASARMIAAYWGIAIDESEFISAIGYSDNPHRGFRGDIDGIFGPLDNYGVYAEPIARYLDTRGFQTKLLVGTEAALKQEIARGRPVLAWLTYDLHHSTPVQVTFNGLPVTLVPWEHAVVVTGYDAGGVYVNGPADGSYTYFDWDNFDRARSYFGGMALTFWPEKKPAVANDSPGVSPYFYRTFLNMGGVDFFGAPLPATRQASGKIVQYFERVRMEYDPKGSPNQPTTLGALGREVSQNESNSVPFQPVTKPTDAAITYFNDTQHRLSNPFQTFWQDNGGQQVFGMPISEPFIENGATVQYFERVRMDVVNGTVRLGAIGQQRLAQLAQDQNCQQTCLRIE